METSEKNGNPRHRTEPILWSRQEKQEVNYEMGATASMIYSGVVDATVGTVVSGALSSISSTYEMQEELDVTLYSLQQEVMKIQCAINAARRRRITDRQLLVWLASLIDAVYLGNYYHRTFKARNSNSQVTAREGDSDLALSSYHVAKRKRTIKTLIFGDEEIKELYNMYMLKKLRSIDVGAFMLMVNNQPEWPIRTYLYMDRNRLVNRDKERDQVLKFLLGPCMTGEYNVDILPIVGSSGGGKNSLAQHCFHDPKVQSHFSLKLYTNCSCDAESEDYNFRSILVCMLTGCDTGEDESTLIAMVKQKFSSERFLFIMDIAWSVGPRAWNVILDCLRCGKQGSKVILIFESNRYNACKNYVNPLEVTPVIVDGFSEDEYVSFFEEHAFGSVDPEDYPDLIKIGKEIARSLGGSLWGAKIFGELLRDNLSTEFWSYFLRDGLSSSQTNLHGKDISQVLPVLFQLLSMSLPAVKNSGIFYTGGRANQDRSYRELLALAPNHSIQLQAIKEGRRKNYWLLLTEHVYLNKPGYIFVEFDFD